MSPENNAEVPYGTLDLMALKTLAGMGPLHGFGIARCIEQVAEGALALNRGAICPAWAVQPHWGGGGRPAPPLFTHRRGEALPRPAAHRAS